MRALDILEQQKAVCRDKREELETAEKMEGALSRMMGADTFKNFEALYPEYEIMVREDWAPELTCDGRLTLHAQVQSPKFWDHAEFRMWAVKGGLGDRYTYAVYLTHYVRDQEFLIYTRWHRDEYWFGKKNDDQDMADWTEMIRRMLASGMPLRLLGDFAKECQRVMPQGVADQIAELARKMVADGMKKQLV